MSEEYIEHDAWNYTPAKLPKQSILKLEEIYGVLDFDGVRNPGSRSSSSHRVWLTYKTPANCFQPKVGICESAAEAAAVHEALIDPDIYDIKLQPLEVPFINDLGKPAKYTHDLSFTLTNGFKRLVFVRNEYSLEKPRTCREISSIAAATPAGAANDMIVMNANEYSRQRRENLFRMHEMCMQQDDEADDVVLWTARNLKSLWHMRDLFPKAGIEQKRVFKSCHRLIARKKLYANLDHTIAEYSRVDVAP